MLLQPIQRPVTQLTQQMGGSPLSLTRPTVPFGGTQQSLLNFSQTSQAENMIANFSKYISSVMSQMMETVNSTINRLLLALTGGQSQNTPSVNGAPIVALGAEMAPAQTDQPSTPFGTTLGSIFNKVGDIWNTGKEILTSGKDLFGGIKGLVGDIWGGIKNIGSSLNLGGIGDFFKNGLGSLLGGLF